MAIGEKIMSVDLDTIVFECDRTYDPANMDTAFSDGRQSSSSKQAPEVIVGTVGIGLGKLITERSRRRSAKDSESDVLQFQTLIPAAIVLQSTLNKALGSIQKKVVENIVDGANQDGRDYFQVRDIQVDVSLCFDENGRNVQVRNPNLPSCILQVCNYLRFVEYSPFPIKSTFITSMNLRHELPPAQVVCHDRVAGQAT